jgi:hypothetical protein
VSEEKVARYRVPPVREQSRRTLAEHFFVRFPSLARPYWSAVMRLPVTSRLRRELVARGARDTAAAWNRRDREVLLNLAGPEFNLYPMGGEAIGGDLEERTRADFEERYRGPEGMMRFFTTVDAAWGDNRLEPQEIIDIGDRYLVLFHNRLRGRGSGIEMDADIGLFFTWSMGRLVRVDYYWSQEEALEAAGLQE